MFFGIQLIDREILCFTGIVAAAIFAPMINDGMTDPERWLSTLIREAATEGAQKALAEAGLPQAWVSKAEAYRLYGRNQVDRWIAEGLLAPKGRLQFIGPSGISRERLEAIAAASNRHTYLPLAER